MTQRHGIVLALIISFLLPFQIFCERNNLYKIANSFLDNKVSLPAFSPLPGAYLGTQSVTITSSQAEAVILYTTDGTTPAHDGNGIPSGTTQEYSTPLTVPSSMTIRAIVYAEGMDDSDVSMAEYLIGETVSAPSLSPGSGTYNSVQDVTISTVTSGASILYTKDGTTPVYDGDGNPIATTQLYSTPVRVSSNMMIQAVAYRPGMYDSAVSFENYTISLTQVAMPSFSPVSGTYGSTQNVTISSATSGATILYTTDNTSPVHNGSGTPLGTTVAYGGPVSVSSSLTIRAIGYYSGMIDSSEAGVSYVISIPQVATPAFSPVAGTYGSTQNVTISSATSGATILYTTDNTLPAHNGSGTPLGTTVVYGGPVPVSSSLTIRAIGYYSGWTDSSEAGASYTINVPEFYVTNFNDNTVMVINSVNHDITHTIPVGSGPYTAGGNPNTQKVYIGNVTSNNVTVIDKVTKNITTIAGVQLPKAISIDTAKNLIYVANSIVGSGTVTVIDGATDTIVDTFAVGSEPYGIAFKPPNKVYVTNASSQSISVFDSSDPSSHLFSTTISGTGAYPREVVYNPNSDRFFVACQNANYVLVIDGSLDSIDTSFTVGTGSRRLVIDVGNDTVYVTNSTSNDVAVINGTTYGVGSNITVGIDPYEIALDAGNSKLMVANFGSNSVNVINSVSKIVIDTIPIGSGPRGICFLP